MSEPLEIKPKFDGTTFRYGPYLVKIGNVLIEFEDHTCEHAINVEIERNMRTTKYHCPPTGVAPIDITVSIESEDCDEIGEIYSKRPATVYAYRKPKQKSP